MKKIPLTQGKFALVDDSDFKNVIQFKWHASKGANGNFYAASSFLTSSGRKPVRLHRFLLPGVSRIDHKDRDGLNNQRNNLRPATAQQNAANRRKQPGAASRFKGVYRQKRRWAARIWVSGKRPFLGTFPTEEAAAKAYDIAAKRYFGEFALLNFTQ